MPKSKCVIAAAGSGKTTHLVQKALETDEDKNILITTFTRENEKEIRKKIIEKNKAIPSNITVMTWWSFLLKHGVRPYQKLITETHVRGLFLTPKRSGFIGLNRARKPMFIPERQTESFYFTKDKKIYSDKIAIFVVRCDEQSKGAVIERLSRVFDEIYIDEVQDLAGYDLEIVLRVLKAIPVMLVGDPRQSTYDTHFSQKHKKYKDGNIAQFIKDKCPDDCEIDDSTLQNSYRCHQGICSYSSSLYPQHPGVDSLLKESTEHDGVFFISPNEVADYIQKYQPVQLRYNKKVVVDDSQPAYNFGESKGLTFDRVLIYPTAPIKNHILGKKLIEGASLCKFYVALTRAKHSAAIVWDKPPAIEGISIYTHKDA